jgi:hypothetical protein
VASCSPCQFSSLFPHSPHSHIAAGGGCADVAIIDPSHGHGWQCALLFYSRCTPPDFASGPVTTLMSVSGQGELAYFTILYGGPSAQSSTAICHDALLLPYHELRWPYRSRDCGLTSASRRSLLYLALLPRQSPPHKIHASPGYLSAAHARG